MYYTGCDFASSTPPTPFPQLLWGRSLRMSSATKKKAVDKREAVQRRKSKLTHLQRQERYQQLKNERLQREREEYESLTPEQKRRRDLKDEKKARKSARGKQKVRWGPGGRNERPLALFSLGSPLVAALAREAFWRMACHAGVLVRLMTVLTR